ncbi:MAG: hypothetical protein Q9213_003448 [Squamulea squamosa]
MSEPPRNVSTFTEVPNTYPVRLSFASPGARPPIYVAGSFTVPEWQPHELEYLVLEHDKTVADNRTSYVFHRNFNVPVGAHHYKFRLGHEGDWWVCDNSTEIVTDALGNQNNLLVVTPSPSELGALDMIAADGTPYSKDAADDTSQPSAAFSDRDHPRDLSNQDERHETTPRGALSPAFEKDQISY